MMNPTRQQALINGLSSVAKRVFGSVPITEPWTVQQIYGELTRTGFSGDKRTVGGCLASLIATGLITEGPSGKFRRVAVKPLTKTPAAVAVAAATKELDMASQTTAALKPALIKNPAPHIDKLAMISNQARSIAEQIKELASNIETAAIEIDEQIKQGTEETAKLKQLQQLLKSLG